jgi:2-amino-4-hydroxy-6-hydroxymethyldihydropteridine diphosphokinase
MADGRWQMADGKWQMANGKWQMEWEGEAVW